MDDPANALSFSVAPQLLATRDVLPPLPPDPGQLLPQGQYCFPPTPSPPADCLPLQPITLLAALGNLRQRGESTFSLPSNFSLPGSFPGASNFPSFGNQNSGQSHSNGGAQTGTSSPTFALTALPDRVPCSLVRTTLPGIRGR